MDSIKYLDIPYSDFTICISCNDSIIVELMRISFFPYLTSEYRYNRPLISINIAYYDNVLKIYNKNNNKCFDYKSKSIDVLLNIIFRFIKNMLSPQSGYNLYHGASFTINEKSVMLLGNSGCGKTTLLTYLLWKRYAYYISEDIIIFNYLKNSIVSYPRPLHLRQSSYDFLSKKYIVDYNNFFGFDSVYYNDYLKRYIFTPKDIKIFDNLPVDYIFCLDISHEENKIEKIISPFDIVLQNCLLPKNLMSNIKSTSLMVQNNNIYKLKTNDLRELSEFLVEFVNKK